MGDAKRVGGPQDQTALKRVMDLHVCARDGGQFCRQVLEQRGACQHLRNFFVATCPCLSVSLSLTRVFVFLRHLGVSRGDGRAGGAAGQGRASR